MLWAIGDRGAEKVTTIPHERDYRIWMSRLDPADILEIENEFEKLVDAAEKEVVTSSWLPGSDWTGTPFYPIYEKAARSDVEAAGKCFGLMLWGYFMQHPANWSFGRYEKDGVPIQGMTYFRIDPSRSSL
jgi:hypothetical protein